MSQLSRDEPELGVRCGSRGLEETLAHVDDYLSSLGHPCGIGLSYDETACHVAYDRARAHIHVMRIVGSNTHGQDTHSSGGPGTRPGKEAND